MTCQFYRAFGASALAIAIAAFQQSAPAADRLNVLPGVPPLEGDVSPARPADIHETFDRINASAEIVCYPMATDRGRTPDQRECPPARGRGRRSAAAILAGMNLRKDEPSGYALAQVR